MNPVGLLWGPHQVRMPTSLIFEGLFMGEKEGSCLPISSLTLPAEEVAQGSLKVDSLSRNALLAVLGLFLYRSRGSGLWITLLFVRFWRGGALTNRQQDRNRCSLPDLALNGDGPFVLVNDGLAYA